MGEMANIEMTHSSVEVPQQVDPNDPPHEFLSIDPGSFWLVLSSPITPDGRVEWGRAADMQLARVNLFAYIVRDMPMSITGYMLQLGAVALHNLPEQYRKRVQRLHLVQSRTMEKGKLANDDVVRTHVGLAVKIGGRP